ncbi:MAG TPA: ABC transporter permease [Bacteroidota bacterium]|nr:ABC transporter permease [Bacteroidota bacterium]
MFRLVYHECIKTFLKKRTYLGFVILLVVIPLIEIAVKIEGARFSSGFLRSLQQDFFFVGNLFNGWIVSHWIMNSLWVHIPILISFVAGDQLAGEATAGTYRLILIRPVSRTRIFFSKYLTTAVYTIVFVVFLGILSVGLALILMGSGQLLVWDSGFLILPSSDVAWRFFAAYIFAAWSMLTVSSIAFFFSSFVENAIGPIIATMGVLIVLLLVSVMPLEFFESIRPYIFTTYINIWQKVFADPVQWPEILEGVTWLGGYSAAMVGGAWLIFVRKDILS